MQGVESTPVLDMEMASWTDDESAPASSPTTASTPQKEPTRIGERITSACVALWGSAWNLTALEFRDNTQVLEALDRIMICEL